jgi:predicted nucleotide-binding protein
MSEMAESLFTLAKRLDDVIQRATSSKFEANLSKLREAANQVGHAWSGSWIGYQSRVYYEALQPTPPGAHFSTEWGAYDRMPMGETSGNWCEYKFDGVRDAIFSRASVESLETEEAFAKHAKEALENVRDEFVSAMTVALANKGDSFLSRLKQQADELKVASKFDYARALQPGRFFTRDTLAASQGLQTPPHIAVIAEITALLEPVHKSEDLAKLIRRAASHLETRERHLHEKNRVGTHVFIGHGRSPAWKDLKDFIQDRLSLPWDEFNRVPVAGITNIARLLQMLDDAAIALIIMTAEDEHADSKVHARMNVVHEAGLFQGRLGFSKAIVLLEEGCEEFSNIHGLGQIRFPKNNIRATFEEVRQVLEREGLL